jgi:hypothetical protein
VEGGTHSCIGLQGTAELQCRNKPESWFVILVNIRDQDFSLLQSPVERVKIYVLGASASSHEPTCTTLTRVLGLQHCRLKKSNFQFLLCFDAYSHWCPETLNIDQSYPRHNFLSRAASHFRRRQTLRIDTLDIRSPMRGWSIIGSIQKSVKTVLNRLHMSLMAREMPIKTVIKEHNMITKSAIGKDDDLESLKFNKPDNMICLFSFCTSVYRLGSATTA